MSDERWVDVSDAADRCVPCEFDGRVSVVRGRVWSYYVSRQGGRLMVVVSRGQGECIRINGTIDVVVLDIHDGEVRLVVSCPPGVSFGHEESCSDRLGQRPRALERGLLEKEHT